MASEELDLAHPRRMDNGLSSRIGLQFARPAAGDQGPDDRNGGFFRMGLESRLQNRNWSSIRDPGSPSGDGSEDEDEDEDGYDDGDEDDGLVSVDEGKHKNGNNSSGSVQSSSVRVCDARASLREQDSGIGMSRGTVAKDGLGIRGDSGEQQQQQERECGYGNEIAVVEPENYYVPILHGGDGSSSGQRETGRENGCGYDGRREIGLAVDTGESLRAHLSDPVTGALMDDAMILSCGHSFGSGGMQHVYRMKSCFKCAHPTSDSSICPNLALRAAVQAFRREEELQFQKASKRRRDRFEQEKCSYDDPSMVDLPRAKGVQFPFVVSDRVIIKGNKRTPQRFVGRIAVVTTQCLNGWYVVKTLDNAESVKLQYRSLAKVADDLPSNMTASKVITPNWL